VADLFLPVATPFEDRDLHFGSWHDRITFTEECVPPRGEALPDRVVWQRLAERLGYGPEFSKSACEWVDAALEPLKAAGVGARALSGKTVTFPGMPAVAHQEGFFATPSGRFEFTSDRAASDTGHAIAAYIGPSDGSNGSPDNHPLRLLSTRKVDHLHSQFYEKLLSPEGLPYAYFSRDDLSSSGLADGDIAVMESPTGSVRVVARETADVPQGVALMYEGGSVLAGKGANVLTPQGETDMGHGPVYYDTFVRIVP
jgi:anaerobic selenocysteine-containing dehydrogenase